MQQQKAIETLKHLGAACVALAELMQGTESVAVAEPLPMPVEKAPRKSKKEDAAKVDKVEETEAKQTKPEELEKPAPDITEDQLRTALVNFAQKNSKEQAYAVLGKYGAKKVNELKKADFPKVLKDLQ